MRKLIFIASIIILIAGCKGNNNTTNNSASSGDSTQMRIPSGQIAYINTDSLISKYGLYIDLKSDYEAKAKKIDGDLNARGRSLEKEFADFQNKVQKYLITQAQAQETGAKLEEKRNNFLQYRETKMREMGEEEQVMLNRIHHSIMEYVKEFNKDYKYSMIITTATSGPIISGDPMLEITSIVLEGLNKQYASEKGSEKEEKTTTDKK